MEYIGNIQDDSLLYLADEIIIYGFGKNGKRVLSFLQEKEIDQAVKKICDMNKEIQNTFVGEKEIKDIDYCVNNFPEATYLITCVDVYRALQLLKGKNIKKIHIITG